MRSRIASLVAIALFAALPLAAQDVSMVVTPNPAPQGSSISVAVTAASQPISVGGCVISGVHQGNPSGPNVMGPIFCITIVLNINACATVTRTWNGNGTGGQPVPPGDYWIRVDIFSVGPLPVASSEFFPLTIVGPASRPTLTALTAPQIGQPLVFGIAAPADPNAPYIAAVSFTTNVGLALSGAQHLALDLDALFALSFPNPLPLLFSGFQGSLDATGSANNITLSLPFAPFLQCTGIACQAAVFPAAGGLQLTNGVSLTIQ